MTQMPGLTNSIYSLFSAERNEVSALWMFCLLVLVSFAFLGVGEFVTIRIYPIQSLVGCQLISQL